MRVVPTVLVISVGGALGDVTCRPWRLAGMWESGDPWLVAMMLTIAVVYVIPLIVADRLFVGVSAQLRPAVLGTTYLMTGAIMSGAGAVIGAPLSAEAYPWTSMLVLAGLACVVGVSLSLGLSSVAGDHCSPQRAAFAALIALLWGATAAQEARACAGAQDVTVLLILVWPLYFVVAPTASLGARIVERYRPLMRGGFILFSLVASGAFLHRWAIAEWYRRIEYAVAVDGLGDSVPRDRRLPAFVPPYATSVRYISDRVSGRGWLTFDLPAAGIPTFVGGLAHLSLRDVSVSLPAAPPRDGREWPDALVEDAGGQDHRLPDYEFYSTMDGSHAIAIEPTGRTRAWSVAR
jgi:hypothetical protein